jgi:hypothetical protein
VAEVRLDRGTLGAQTKPRIFEGTVARVHSPEDPLPYSSGPEHRDLAELLHIVEQLPGLPVVTSVEPDVENPLGHPDNLIISGVEYHEIGRVMGARLSDDGRAVADIYIHDKGALQEIEDGTKGLSLGYRCTLDQDRFQRNIQLDHLSVVTRPRCGEQCSLRTDALPEQPCGCLAQIVPPATIASMKVADVTVGMTIALDEKSEQILSTLSQLTTSANVDGAEPPRHDSCTCEKMSHTIGETNMDLAELTKKLDDALAEIATLTAAATQSELAFTQAGLDLKKAEADLATLTSEIAAVKSDAKAKVDAAQSARTDADDAAFHAAVDARVDLLADAAAVGIEDSKTKTDREIKVAIVNKVDEMVIEDTRPLDYVDGMYAGAMKRHTKAATSVAEVRTLIVENNDAADKAVADPYKAETEIREAAEAKRKNRWR